MTFEEWSADGLRRFGEDRSTWRFVCPACGHVAPASAWAEVDAPDGAFGFACVGRWIEGSSQAFSGEPGPCTYTGGGLFQYNPIKVTFPDGDTTTFFDFAEAS